MESKSIVKALSLVALAHEANIDQLMSGTQQIAHFGNSTEHVRRAKGTGLLIAGFLMLAASGVLNLIALFM